MQSSLIYFRYRGGFKALELTIVECNRTVDEAYEKVPGEGSIIWAASAVQYGIFGV